MKRCETLKILIVLSIAFLLCSCSSQQQKIPGTNLDEKFFELNHATLQAPTLTFSEMEKQIGQFNKYIGSYPPRFTSESEREAVYKNWLALVVEAEAFNSANPGTEQSLYLLSELYRQGHNMDVRGSAEKALKNLDSCLSAFEYSVPCNFSASYFYLSIGPEYLDKAQSSLDALKLHYAPNLNDEVEAGYVFLYLYRQNVPMAKKQISSFIANFPNSSRVTAFTDIRDNLGETIEWKKQ